MSWQSDSCAFILAGGQGSRLRPYTAVLPKPLIPVCDVPICEVLVHQLRNAGFRRLILGVNHHEGLLRSYFRDGSEFGVEVSYSRESAPLGTVGPLRLVADRLPDVFLVTNGDLLTDLNFAEFIEGHLASDRLLTIATHRRTLRCGDGVMDIGADGTIQAFREKPSFEFWISTGIYAMRRSILDLVPERGPLGMDELVLTMLKHGIPVGTHRHEGEWYDIGSLADLERANGAFAERRSTFLPERSTSLTGVA